jgi:hypothetical protein
MWGFVAHYNRDGFYETFFTSSERRLRFLRMAIDWPYMTKGWGYGDPRYTWGDVEESLTRWLLEAGVAEQVERECALDVEARERALLATLMRKYQDKPISPELLPTTQSHN